MNKFGRRDFLKFAAAVPVSLALSKLVSYEASAKDSIKSNAPNIIFLVFDAMSAYHLSVYGYHRKTTPNFERFAKRANVYHTHYSTANFTVPGTASMLNGMYPWTHRGLHLSGLVKRDLVERNIFGLLGNKYHRFAFSQNVWATNLLLQFKSDIDELLPTSAFSDFSFLVSEIFKNDEGNAHQINDHLLFDYVDAPGSLLFGLAQRLYFERKKKKYDRNYPRGIPQPRNHPYNFFLDDVFDGLINTIERLPDPSFSYIHLFSPHAPYRAHKDFIGIFEGTEPHIQKPEHIFTEGEPYETIEDHRIWYDEYIKNVDHEFGRLLDYLEQKGILENSYLVVTSDHGELLERGIKGHVTPVLYEPLVRVPLIISTPGQSQGKEIYSPTSSVDLLPSLLHPAGEDIPDWAEGKLLPGLGGSEDFEREIFMLEAKSSSAFGALHQATFAMRKGKYKIILYRGYHATDGDLFEIYDLENDPEEMNDLVHSHPVLANELKSELLKKFDEINSTG